MGKGYKYFESADSYEKAQQAQSDELDKAALKRVLDRRYKQKEKDVKELENKVSAAEQQWRSATGSPDYTAKRDAYENLRKEYNDSVSALRMWKDNQQKAVDHLDVNWNGELYPSEGAASGGTSSGGTSSEGTSSEGTSSEGTSSEGASSEGTSSEGTSSEGKETEDKRPQLAKNIEEGGNAFVRNFNVSDSFRRDVGAAIRHKPMGNLADIKSAEAKAQSDNLQNDAAHRQMEAQQAQQKADRNKYTEAGKEASVKNDQMNQAKLHGKEGLTGSAAAAERTYEAADPRAIDTQQDELRQTAAQQRTEMDTAQQAATQADSESKQWAIGSRDHDTDLDKSGKLSRGSGYGYDSEHIDETKQEEPKPEPEEPKPEPEEPKPEEPAGNPQPKGDPQHVINWLLGSSKGQDIKPQKGTDGDNALAQWVVDTYGVSPVTKWKYNETQPDPKYWEQMWLDDGDVPGDKKGAIQALRQGRAGEGNDAATNYTGSDDPNMNHEMQVQSNPPSDARVKNIRDVLSDAKMKFIKEDWDRDGKIAPENFRFLLARIGKFNHNGRDYDAFNADDWTDDTDQSVLQAYADNIRNYLYTYKPEAKIADASIDTEEEHIGPMAQDIEKVNPACVKETPEGIKTVDTARLAMMNAGAIGDLARQMQELTDKLKMLGL